jgi:peptidoglycan hydrolase-like protein with peptidoglycan-binding domain
MKHFLRYAIITLLFAFAILPVKAVAQYDSAGTTPSQRQRIHEWHQSSQLQQSITALGTTPVIAIPMPVLFGVAPSNLTPNFGDPRDNGTRTHEGEDIMAVKGTPIVSPTAAVVLRITTDLTSSEGNAVYTANPGGETFVYYHLDRIGEGVVSGLVLGQGSLIGYVGNTGNAAGGAAHLHLEIHNSSGTPTDPFPRLTAEFTPAQKISFITTILTQTSDPVSLSQFLVTNFRSTLTSDVQNGITLPSLIITALATVPGATPTIGNLPAGDLMIGSSGSVVIRLQQFLITKAVGPAAVRLAGAGATGYFGSITKAALIEYQVASGISPADGYYGYATRALAEASIGTTPATPATDAGCLPGNNFSTTTGRSCSSVTASTNSGFNRNLIVGMTGSDVGALQVWLNTHGYVLALSGPGSSGNETTTFGGLTRTALAKFQADVGISPAVGYFGPITRSYLSTHQ